MTSTPAAPPDRAKRLLDLAVAVPALVVLSPVLLAIAVAVRVDSRGPALFRQERVGLGGEVFRLHKFRSMRASHDGALVSPTGDSRVTRVGRFLRRTKLDELPQLIDVATGHMSLVGPRPEVPRYAALWDPEQARVILSVRPGITDPVSIAFRHESDLLAAAEDPEAHYRDVILPQKAAMYVDYVQHRTLLGDLRILLQTFVAVVRD